MPRDDAAILDILKAANLALITPAKGRSMLTWVGKQPLSHVTAFLARRSAAGCPLQCLV